MAHPETEWPSQQNIPIFYFFLFHYFLVPLADTFSVEPSPESLHLGASYLCRGLDIRNICIEFITQPLQIVRINYKIIKYFPVNTRKRLIVCN